VPAGQPSQWQVMGAVRSTHRALKPSTVTWWLMVDGFSTTSGQANATARWLSSCSAALMQSANLLNTPSHSHYKQCLADTGISSSSGPGGGGTGQLLSFWPTTPGGVPCLQHAWSDNKITCHCILPLYNRA